MNETAKKQPVMFVRGCRGDGESERARHDKQFLRQRLAEAGIDDPGAVVIVDEADARAPRRAAYQRLTSMLDAGDVDALAIRDLSRLTRRTNCVWALAELLDRHGVRLVLADGLVSRERLSLLATVDSLLSAFVAQRVRRSSKLSRTRTGLSGLAGGKEADQSND